MTTGEQLDSVDPSDTVELLATGELRVRDRIADASNLVLRASIVGPDGALECVYKPVAGERPLWDFPGATLAAREVLTARVAAAFGWDVVPTTVWRADGPFGAGMCQAWVDVDDEARPPVALVEPTAFGSGWRVVASGQSPEGGTVVLVHAEDLDLQRVALLDVLVNNADRKGGHLLRRRAGGLAAIDHGVTFHAEPKLRTVLWGWAGEPVPEQLMAELADGTPGMRALLAEPDLPIDDRERTASAGRLEALLRDAEFPMPGRDWPALPWPPI